VIQMRIESSKVERSNYTGRVIFIPYAVIEPTKPDSPVHFTVYVQMRISTVHGSAEMTIELSELVRAIREVEREAGEILKAVKAIISTLHR